MNDRSLIPFPKEEGSAHHLSCGLATKQIRSIAVGIFPPFELFADGRLIAEYDSAAQAEAAFQAFRAEIRAQAESDACSAHH